jgi:hypothetical protein
MYEAERDRAPDHGTVNFLVLFIVPSGVTTLITPVFAPAGTTAVMRELESTVNCVAATPPNDTEVAPSGLRVGSRSVLSPDLTSARNS